jgi:hypothetical protein
MKTPVHGQRRHTMKKAADPIMKPSISKPTMLRVWPKVSTGGKARTVGVDTLTKVVEVVDEIPEPVVIS